MEGHNQIIIIYMQSHAHKCARSCVPAYVPLCLLLLHIIQQLILASKLLLKLLDTRAHYCCHRVLYLFLLEFLLCLSKVVFRYHLLIHGLLDGLVRACEGTLNRLSILADVSHLFICLFCLSLYLVKFPFVLGFKLVNFALLCFFVLFLHFQFCLELIDLISQCLCDLVLVVGVQLLGDLPLYFIVELCLQIGVLRLK